MSLEEARRIGSQKPRLHTPLSDSPSLGLEVIDFANAVGLPFMDWQEFIARDALTIRPNSDFEKRTIGVLAPRQNGKSHVVRMMILWSMFIQNRSWLSMAQNRQLALEQFEQAIRIIESVDWLASQVKRVSKTNGKEYLELLNGARWHVVAATKEGARGFSANLWIDELRDITPEAYKASTPVTRAVIPPALTIVSSNAGDAHSEVLNNLRTQALTDKSGLIGWYEWSGDPHLHHLDEENWYIANPSLGILIDEEVIRQASKTDTLGAFKTESLCLWVDNMAAAFNMENFTLCYEPNLKPSKENVTYLAIDLSPDRRRADLAIAQVLDETRIAVSIIQTWTSQDSINDVKVAGEVAKIAREWRVYGIGYNRWASAAIAQRLQLAGLKTIDISGADFAQACDETASAIDSKRLAHDSSAALLEHFSNCVRKESSLGGWRVVKNQANAGISAACASIMAIHLANRPNVQPMVYS